MTTEPSGNNPSGIVHDIENAETLAGPGVIPRCNDIVADYDRGGILVVPAGGVPPLDGKRFEEGAEILAGPGAGTKPNWRATADRHESKGEKKLIRDITSVLAALRHEPTLASCFAHDDMLNDAVVIKELPAALGAPALDGPLPRPISEADITRLQEWLQRNGLSRIGRDMVYHAIEKRALENRFHPVRDYLRGLVWDGTKRAEKWLTYYLGAEPTAYTAAIGKMFLVGMVARVMRPGCQYDYMLVIEGPQGTGKSTACRILGGSYFSNNLPDLKDGRLTGQHLRGKWIVAIEELAGMNRAETDAIKAFLTRTEERYRPPYAAKEVVEPRQCVLVGTTNRSAYLRDETGGRRFWPVLTGSIDAQALAHDRDQLLAEAVNLFDNGAQWWPDAAFEAEHIKPEQDARFETDAWEDIIKEHLALRTRTTVADAAKLALGLETGRIGTAEQRRIRAILLRLGWKLSRSNGVRWYVRED